MFVASLKLLDMQRMGLYDRMRKLIEGLDKAI